MGQSIPTSIPGAGEPILLATCRGASPASAPGSPARRAAALAGRGGGGEDCPHSADTL